MRKCELLPEHDLKHLCEYVQELMLEESTVQPVQSPVTICGDIHGQFHDLLELFRNGGECPMTSYIFMVCCCGVQEENRTLLLFCFPFLLQTRTCRSARCWCRSAHPLSTALFFVHSVRATLSTAGTTASRR